MDGQERTRSIKRGADDDFRPGFVRIEEPKNGEGYQRRRRRGLRSREGGRERQRERERARHDISRIVYLETPLRASSIQEPVAGSAGAFV